LNSSATRVIVGATSLIGGLLRAKVDIIVVGGTAAIRAAQRATQSTGTPRNDPFREEFVRGMRDLGYVEGRNIAYEFRHYGDDVESIPNH
jgi:hypothetical protein